MTEITTIDWSGGKGASVFSENTAIFVICFYIETLLAIYLKKTI